MSNFNFSKASLANLNGVNPNLVKVVYRALELTSVDFKVIEGLRTVERQKQLVAAGKSKTMASKHIEGRAVDLFPIGGDWNKYTDWLPVLDAMHKAGAELGVKLRFGITWTDNPKDKPAKFLDAPHVELA
ncbi:peptidase M15 [Pectobacterium phage POP12]|nr:peptidase M15 [Pectobacterium phage POP12]